jgi:hypothetical protein
LHLPIAKVGRLLEQQEHDGLPDVLRRLRVARAPPGGGRNLTGVPLDQLVKRRFTATLDEGQKKFSVASQHGLTTTRCSAGRGPGEDFRGLLDPRDKSRELDNLLTNCEGMCSKV